MNRQAWQTALGRRGTDASRWLSTPTPSTFFPVIPATTITVRGRQPFSSTSASLADENNNNSARRPSSRERSQAAASQISALRSAADSSRPRPVDARSLGGAGPGARTPVDGSKVFTLRSIRGGALRGRAGGLGSAQGGRGGAFARPDGSMPRFAPGARGAGASFRGRAGAGGRGKRGGGRGGRGGRRGDEAKEKKKKDFDDNKAPLVWTAEEKAVFDKIEQGVLTDYAPKVTEKDLTGYGPAVASGTTHAKVESVMYAMRMMGGAMPFNSDSGVTGDTRETTKRYVHEKLPVFFNSVEEKRWMERGIRRRIRGPEDSTKEAILDAVARGKYEKPGFVDAKNAIGMTSAYLESTTSYKASDAERFLKKLQELMPAEAAAKSKAAAQPKTVR